MMRMMDGGTSLTHAGTGREAQRQSADVSLELIDCFFQSYNYIKEPRACYFIFCHYIAELSLWLSFVFIALTQTQAEIFY